MPLVEESMDYAQSLSPLAVSMDTAVSQSTVLTAQWDHLQQTYGH